MGRYKKEIANRVQETKPHDAEIEITEPCDLLRKVPWDDRYREVEKILGRGNHLPMECPGNPKRFANRVEIQAEGPILHEETCIGFVTARIMVWFEEPRFLRYPRTIDPLSSGA